MIKNISKNQIEKFLQLNKSFIVCTYYVDSFSNFYAAMMNKYLEKDKYKIEPVWVRSCW